MNSKISWDLTEYAGKPQIIVIPRRLTVYEQFCKLTFEIRKAVLSQSSSGGILAEASSILEGIRYRIADSLIDPTKDLNLVRKMLISAKEEASHELLIEGSSAIVDDLIVLITPVMFPSEDSSKLDVGLSPLAQEILERNKYIATKIFSLVSPENNKRVVLFTRKESNATDTKNYLAKISPRLKLALMKRNLVVAPYRSNSVDSGVRISEAFDVQILLALPEAYAKPPLFGKLSKSDITVQTSWMVASPLAPKVIIFSQSGQKGWKDKILKSAQNLEVDLSPFSESDSKIIGKISGFDTISNETALSSDIYEQYSALWSNIKQQSRQNYSDIEDLVECYKVLGTNGEKVFSYNIKKQGKVRKIIYNPITEEFQIESVKSREVSEGDLILTSLEGADKKLLAEEAKIHWQKSKYKTVSTYGDAVLYISSIHKKVKSHLRHDKEGLIEKIKNPNGVSHTITFKKSDEDYLDYVLRAMASSSIFGPSKSKQIFFDWICRAVGESDIRYEIIEALRSSHQIAGQALSNKKIEEINQGSFKDDIYNAIYGGSDSSISGCWFGSKSSASGVGSSILQSTAIFKVQGIMPQTYLVPTKDVGTIIE
jgi:hypothetical protein